jgi:hypothetical protein
MGTVNEALQMQKHASFDGALLDGNLRGQKVDEIAAALTRRNIPFLFVSGYGPESGAGDNSSDAARSAEAGGQDGHTDWAGRRTASLPGNQGR